MWLWCQPKGLHWFFCLCQLSWALPQHTGEWGSCLHPFMARCDFRAGCTWCLLSHQPLQPSSTYTQCCSSERPFALQDTTPSKKHNHFLLGSRARADSPGGAINACSAEDATLWVCHQEQPRHITSSSPTCPRGPEQCWWLSQIRDARKASLVRKTSGNAL